jgi:hypothetical protein
MKILYLEEITSDFNFIIKDILFNISTEIEFFNTKNFRLLLNRNDIIENKNILVVNDLCSNTDIIDVISFIKPVIIFYPSDEEGKNPNMSQFEKYTKLLFRQYNFKNFNYSSNNYHIPLGYFTSYLSGKNSLSIKQKPIKERKINCSFIGEIKSDRIIMIHTFKSNMENTNFVCVKNTWDINNLPFPCEKCFDLYSNSIFVVCGRGNSNLNCYRIYEAIIAGAIPVVVGSIDEITTSFNFNGTIPPFIFEFTWENAVNKCNQLLNDYEKLQKIQNALLFWWKERLLFINQLIVKELTK